MDGFLSLQKSSFGGLKRWKSHWFVLCDGTLKYLAGDAEVMSLQIASVRDRSVVRPRSFAVDDGTSLCWFLCAPDDASYRAWNDALARQIRGRPPSPAHQPNIVGALVGSEPQSERPAQAGAHEVASHEEEDGDCTGYAAELYKWQGRCFVAAALACVLLVLLAWLGSLLWLWPQCCAPCDAVRRAVQNPFAPVALAIMTMVGTDSTRSSLQGSFMGVPGVAADSSWPSACAAVCSVVVVAVVCWRLLLPPRRAPLVPAAAHAHAVQRALPAHMGALASDGAAADAELSADGLVAASNDPLPLVAADITKFAEDGARGGGIGAGAHVAHAVTTLPPLAEWPQSTAPLLFRLCPWAPGLRRIVATPIDDGSGGGASSSAGPLSVNGPGSSHVFEFDGPLFKGRAALRAFGVGNHQGGYFDGRKRRMQLLVQGHFKRELRMDEVQTGQEFSRPLLRLPARWLITACMKVIRRLSPSVQTDITGARPQMLSNLAATAQTLHVSAPGEQPPSLTAPAGGGAFVDVPESTALLGGHFAKAGGKPVGSTARKKFFSSRKRAADFAFLPGNTYTFDFYQHMLLPASFELDFGVMRVGLLAALNSQPVQLMAKLQNSDQYLWSVEMWHARQCQAAATAADHQATSSARVVVEPGCLDQVTASAGGGVHHPSSCICEQCCSAHECPASGGDRPVKLPPADQLLELVAIMRKAGLAANRRYRATMYSSVFVGSEAVDWMIVQRPAGIDAQTRPQAVRVLNDLFAAGHIAHVVDEHKFEDKFLFYRFCSQRDDARVA